MHMEIGQTITLHQYTCTRSYCQHNGWYISQSVMIKVKVNVTQSFVQKCSMVFTHLIGRTDEL